jgi:hypothetical protein
MDLAAWLRAGRDRRKLTIEDVAKVTKIQARILEKLENGQLEGLPAEVFVKGFVRSFAKCVGLDESEAIEKYGAAQAQIAQPAGVAVAKALVETMARPVELEAIIEAKRVAQGTPLEPAPVVPAVVDAPVEVAPIEVAATKSVEIAPIEIAPVVEVVPAVEVAADGAQPAKKKRARKNSKQRAKKKKEIQQELTAVAESVAIVDHDALDTTVFDKQSMSIDTGGPVAQIDATSIESASIEVKTSEVLDVPSAAIDGAVDTPSLAEGSHRISQSAIAVVDVAQPEPVAIDATMVAAQIAVETEAAAGTWQPTMPPLSTPSAPWRRPNLPASTASAYVVPTLVIDDADPDSADRERDDRIAKEPHRLSFLPPILLDREDRSARQGGLTLAVIILLIAATLTLSYLMRRPSPSGDGVTMIDSSSMLIS